jgi:hypothetical protein
MPRGTRLIIRRLIVPLTLAVLAVQATAACAQGAFPAPLPNSAASPFPPVNGAAPPANDPAFPPVTGAAPRPMIGTPSAFPSGGASPMSGGFSQPQGGFSPPQQAGPSADCMNGFLPLRQEAEKRGAAIKVASERHATPDVACKLIKNFADSEAKLIKYVEVHQAKCGIPPQVSDQLKTGHKNTENMMTKVCAVAAQGPRAPAGPSLSDVLGSSTALPEAAAAKKNGGSTFDTLSGNVLAR